jgi:hypothetical protein
MATIWQKLAALVNFHCPAAFGSSGFLNRNEPRSGFPQSSFGRSGVDSHESLGYQGAKLSRSLSTKGEADVVFKGLIAAVAAVGLSATPAIAAANSSAATARAVASAQPAPAAETVEGESEMFGRGGFIIPLLVIITILVGIYIAVDDNGDGPPVSP